MAHSEDYAMKFHPVYAMSLQLDYGKQRFMNYSGHAGEVLTDLIPKDWKVIIKVNGCILCGGPNAFWVEGGGEI